MNPLLIAFHEGLISEAKNFLLQYQNALGVYGFNLQLLEPNTLKFRLHIATDAGVFGVRNPKGYYLDFNAKAVSPSLLPLFHGYLYSRFFQ